MSTDYYIQDLELSEAAGVPYFLAPNALDFTTDIKKAGTFSKDEAVWFVNSDKRNKTVMIPTIGAFKTRSMS